MNLYVRRLADDLSEAGLQVDVYTRRTDRESPEIIERNSGARVIHVTAGPSRRLPKNVLPLHLPAMVAAMKSFTDAHSLQYDVLHSHYWLSGLAAMRFRARCQSNMPLVHMFHTLERVKDFYLGEPDPTDSALRADGERCLITRADVVVGSTDSEHDEMSRLYGRGPSRFRLIPPGVDLGTFRPLNKTRSRQILGVTSRRVIVFVGRQDRMKGLDVLLRSVAELPSSLRDDLAVLLVGGHDIGRVGSRTASLITKFGLEDCVQARGKALQSELAVYYSAADICAVPSAYESFGMAAAESMACQTPVVAFSVGGLASTVKHGQTGFLARAGSSTEFSARLEEALYSPLLDAMGRQARMSVQRFSWDSVTTRTLDLYEDVVAQADELSLPALAGS